MEFIVDRVKHSLFLFKLVLWLRGLLFENKIPDTLLYKLKTYVLDLSQNILDIEALNNQLANDINHLNNKEELEYLKKTGNAINENKLLLFKSKACRTTKIRKYKSIRIVRYYDIVELCGLIDRVFIIYIDMDNICGFYSLCKENAAELQDAFYYTVKLSTITNKF